MKDCILTFDYELFLGKDSGTCQKSIIEPTEEIIKILKKFNSKAIFFVDAAYLLLLRQYRHPDLKKIEQQLRKIVELDSSIELHLHPQWLDAKPLSETRWMFDSMDRYRLHSLSQNDLKNIFYDSISILKDISQSDISIFRAGGWSISPFSFLRDAFIENNIKIDMSVCNGFYKNNPPLHYYDFRKSPNKEYYRFEYDICVEKKDGSFLEIPVSTYQVHGIDLIINNIIKKITKDKIFGDGMGVEDKSVMDSIIKKAIALNVKRATIEGQSLYLFYKSYYKLKNRNLLSYVMHPKTICKTSLKNLSYLCSNTRTLNSCDIIGNYLYK